MKIDNITILCIDKRKHLWAALEEQVEDIFDITPTKFICGSGDDKDLKYDWIDKDIYPTEGWRYGTGISATRHYRAHLAHKKIIAKAMKAKHESVLLLEDDAIFMERAKEGLRQLNDMSAMLREADLIYLGWHAHEYVNDKAVGINLDIEKQYLENEFRCFYGEKPIYNVGGFHAVIINQSTYKKLLNTPIYNPLDSIVNHNPDLFNRYLLVPKIVFDPQGWSECDQREVKR